MTASEAQDFRRTMIRLAALFFLIAVVLASVTVGYMVYSSHEIKNTERAARETARTTEKEAEYRLYKAAIANCNRIMANRYSSNKTARIVKQFLQVAVDARDRAAAAARKRGDSAAAKDNADVAALERALADGFGTLPTHDCTLLIPMVSPPPK